MLADLRDVPWVDVCKLFTDSRLAVPGCFDYKLKSVGRALHARGAIEHTWPEGEIGNGLQAMRHAHALYTDGGMRTRKRTHDGLTTVQRYNVADTAVLYDIVELLEDM